MTTLTLALRDTHWGVAIRSLLLVSILTLAACVTVVPKKDLPPRFAYMAQATEATQLFARYAPVFVHQQDIKRYNRIGHAVAREHESGEIRVAIEAKSPAMYVQRMEFTGQYGHYTNLIYRVHFEQVPHSLIPFHITAGNNGGLLIIVTLNANRQPLLYTTVHSCGCYLAFVPTGYLPENAYPEDWDINTQKVYGERLPGRLLFTTNGNDSQHLLVTLKAGNHRVMDLDLHTLIDIDRDYQLVPTPLVPMTSLKHLPVNGHTTSFFHNEGSRKGYVRNASKPWELLLMSWWTLDSKVGVDKEYGDHTQTGTVFYTSLKPWKRRASDMWPFADFLKFWGWGF